MKVKLWQWLVGVVVVILLVLAGIALGRMWRGDDTVLPESNVNQQSVQPPQDT